jgi:hypothetical protein
LRRAPRRGEHDDLAKRRCFTDAPCGGALADLLQQGDDFRFALIRHAEFDLVSAIRPAFAERAPNIASSDDSNSHSRLVCSINKPGMQDYP